MPPRSVDITVPDLRRRIGDIEPDAPARLPWAIGGLVIAVLSALLWLCGYELVTVLVRLFAHIA